MTKAKLSVVGEDIIRAEKGIPLPKRRSGFAEGESKYPWTTMEIGESFAVPADVEKHFSCQAVQAGRKYERRFSVRKMADGTRRCWRIQ